MTKTNFTDMPLKDKKKVANKAMDIAIKEQRRVMKQNKQVEQIKRIIDNVSRATTEYISSKIIREQREFEYARAFNDISNLLTQTRQEAVEEEKQLIMSDYEKWCEETSWGSDESHRERLEEKMEFLLKALSLKENL
ncbi:MAG: hypothetical protein ABIJ18_01465 [archaeon]